MIAIGTPAGERPSWRYVRSLLGLRMPGGSLFYAVRGKHGVDGARNNIVRWFLQTPCEWLLQIDADAVMHPGTLERLLSWNEPVVAALAFLRYAPFTPAAWNGQADDGKFFIDLDRVRDWLRRYPELAQRDRPAMLADRPDDALVLVDRFGTHCFLVHRSVYESMEPPWFERKADDKHGEGSDFTFCRKVLDIGFQPCVDRSVVAGHLADDWCLTALDFVAWDAITNWETQEILVEV